jgi:asparagine synthase (glutamine-hydrolysing)
MAKAMLSVIEHRGPDGEGIWSEQGCVLGHRRLAIIDVTDAGAQPKHSADERYVITYNGEVYNYVELRAELEALGIPFSTASDTEVLLAAWCQWGAGCLPKLNGMFAFAIYDRQEQKLTCVRDRLGVKPFVYTWDGQRFGFASEVKALLAAGLTNGEPNANAIYEYLARGYTTNGRSFHDGVEVLQPGSMLVIDRHGALQTTEWWQPNRATDFSLTRPEWTERIADLLDDAVRIRLRSDVPVGCHLSGGLDSSAVTAAAARHSGDSINTFTGAFLDEPNADEREYSRAVNARYGLQAHEIEMSVDELPDHFARILWHMDEPIAGQGVFPQLLVCDLAARNEVKVVLGGQGGDELFGGYLRHRALYYKLVARGGSLGARASAAMELARLGMSEWRRVSRTSTRAGDEQLAASFLDLVDPAVREEARHSRLSFDSVADLMWHDLRSYLPALLHVEDRTSMAASIESRTPLLDWRLVELALQIPEDLLFTRGRAKPLLADAVRDWIPASVANRRDKRGFPTPIDKWKKLQALGTLVTELTTPNAPVARGRWRVPGEHADGFAVFADDYLAQRATMTQSEIWTVLSVNGWLCALDQGALRTPRQLAA